MANNDQVMSAMMMGNMFGPNPYAPYQNVPLPWPSSYAGTPTNAMGQPIQQAPGTTLNSLPLSSAAPQQQAAPQSNQWALNNDLYNAMGRNLSMGNRGGMSMGDIVDMRAANNAAYGMKQPYGGPVLQSQGPNAAQAAQQQGAPGGNTMGLNNALSLLANPGNPTTPGATVPQAPSAGMRPSVLNQFLNSTSQGGAGAGNYNNAGFFNTLRQLQAGG